MTTPSPEDALRAAHENLILIAAPEADRTRALIADAVERGDAEVVRREGHSWSGRIGLDLLALADAIDGGQP